MTLQDIANEMMKEIDRFSVVKEVEVPTVVQKKTHKKWRINKKWKKRYGMELVYIKKRARVADITVDNVVEFCHEKGLPLPEEFMNNTK